MYPPKNEANCLTFICVFHFLPSLSWSLSVFSYFLDRERVCFSLTVSVSFFFSIFSWSKACFLSFYFLVFFHKFPPQGSVAVSAAGGQIVLPHPVTSTQPLQAHTSHTGRCIEWLGGRMVGERIDELACLMD